MCQALHLCPAVSHDLHARWKVILWTRRQRWREVKQPVQSLADEWLRPEPAPSPQPVSFQPRLLLLYGAWSLPALQPAGLVVLRQGLGSLPPCPSAPSPELWTGTAKQLPPLPSTLEGNMLFLDDKPQGATNSYCRHMWVAQDSGTCPCPCASPF